MRKLFLLPFLLCACPDDGVVTESGSTSPTASSEGFSSTGGPVDPTSGSGSSSSSGGSSSSSTGSDSSGSGSSSGSSSSSGGSSSTGAEVCAPPSEKLWGPCGPERQCDLGFCLGPTPGICVSDCGMGLCDGLGCGSTECRPDGSCVMACPCEVPGMGCDAALNACVWI